MSDIESQSSRVLDEVRSFLTDPDFKAEILAAVSRAKVRRQMDLELHRLRRELMHASQNDLPLPELLVRPNESVTFAVSEKIPRQVLEFQKMGLCDVTMNRCRQSGKLVQVVVLTKLGRQMAQELNISLSQQERLAA